MDGASPRNRLLRVAACPDFSLRFAASGLRNQCTPSADPGSRGGGGHSWCLARASLEKLEFAHYCKRLNSVILQGLPSPSVKSETY